MVTSVFSEDELDHFKIEARPCKGGMPTPSTDHMLSRSRLPRPLDSTSRRASSRWVVLRKIHPSKSHIPTTHPTHVRRPSFGKKFDLAYAIGVRTQVCHNTAWITDVDRGHYHTRKHRLKP